jgi:hypothetical protein
VNETPLCGAKSCGKGDRETENRKMKSLNMKLALSAVAIAIAMLATPALAKTHRHVSTQQQQQNDAGTSAIQQGPVLHYPNGGVGRTGTAQSLESGAEFNLGY